MCQHCDGHLRACRGKLNGGISLGGAGGAVHDLAREVQRELNLRRSAIDLPGLLETAALGQTFHGVELPELAGCRPSLRAAQLAHCV
jgi:hypothetical protein